MKKNAAIYPRRTLIKAHRFIAISNTGGGVSSPPCFGGMLMQKPATPLPVHKDTDRGSQITAGKTVFTVNVHFGKESLDNILRRRILGERGQKIR